MADEIALTAERNAGLRAQQLLDNETFKAAFAALQAEYTAAWRASEPSDVQGRERLYTAIQVLDRVKSHLGTVAASGRLAERELRDLAGKRSRFGL